MICVPADNLFQAHPASLLTANCTESWGNCVAQLRSAQSSEVQLSQPIQAVHSKRGCNYPEPVISGGRLGFGECVPLLHISVLFTLQPHRSPPAKGHFFSWRITLTLQSGQGWAFNIHLSDVSRRAELTHSDTHSREINLKHKVTAVSPSGFLHGSGTVNKFKREISKTDFNLV
ncbi:hypothetical protein Q8A67_018316 [Cirrhinus molitorella]|uniref:Uncharacterized protein n=1 Tax=Cirrhinus molitorella TaxID=172907 RepID=A0AA88PE68_9TELE|nr:hypothetical protein Q8A67_018316 [Cirrhinus molitorella]